MQTAIHPARDTAGLHQACVALFEEAFHRRAIEKTFEGRQADKDIRAAALADIATRRLSPGYYARASYVLGLANAIEWGVRYSAAELPYDDVQALGVVRNARTEFENDHPACPQCGERQDNRFAFNCRACGIKFHRGGD